MPLTKIIIKYHNSNYQLLDTRVREGGKMNSWDGKTIRLKGDLTLINFEEIGTLLDIEKRCYYDLNNTAFFLVRRIEDGSHYQNLVADVVAEFSTQEETAHADINKFIDELVRHDLVIIQEGESEYVIAQRGKIGDKPYQSPTLNYETELTVAAALNVVTGGTVG